MKRLIYRRKETRILGSKLEMHRAKKTWMVKRDHPNNLVAETKEIGAQRKEGIQRIRSERVLVYSIGKYGETRTEVRTSHPHTRGFMAFEEYANYFVCNSSCRNAFG